MGRIASIDYGLARLGIAVSDPTKSIASPHPTLLAGRTNEETARTVMEALSKYEIESIVVGIPFNMDGSKGKQAELVESFISSLQKLTPLPIIRWDERLTSAQANKLMKEDNVNRKKRSKSVDAVAALLILQSYLDSI